MKNALLSYFLVLKIADDYQLYSLAASIYIQMGNVNFFVQQAEKAVSYYRNAIQNFRISSDQKAINEANIRTYMTMYFLESYPSDSALFYVRKTLDYSRKNKDRLGEAHAMMVLGMIYLGAPDMLSKRSIGLKYSDSAMAIVQTLKNLERISIINLNLGYYYMELSYRITDTPRNLFLSKIHNQKGFEAATEAGSNYLQVICLNGLAEIALFERNYEHAGTYLEIVESKLMDFNSFSYGESVSTSDELFERVFQYYLMRREKTRAYEIQFNLAMAKGEYRKAVEYQQLNYLAYEEFRAEQEGKQVELLVAEAEDEKTDQKIRSLAQDNELNQLRFLRTRYILGGIGAGVLIISLFILIFLQRKKWRAEQKSVNLEQKLLRSQMNPHFIFNSLASIQNFIINQKTSEAIIYLARFSQLVRNILDSSVDENVPLQKEIETIRNYLDLQQVRYSGQFDYNLSVDTAIDEETMMIPPMLAQPFIENAIEHGIKYKETMGKIDIRFKLEDDIIRFEVEDDGVGREKAKEIELKQKRIHRSMSTSITQERLIKLNKKLKHKIKMEIIDLKDNLGVACGTKVSFGIPVVVK